MSSSSFTELDIQILTKPENTKKTSDIQQADTNDSDLSSKNNILLSKKSKSSLDCLTGLHTHWRLHKEEESQNQEATSEMERPVHHSSEYS